MLIILEEGAQNHCAQFFCYVPHEQLSDTRYPSMCATFVVSCEMYCISCLVSGETGDLV